ncbi:MAG: hypothetical protein K8W52_21370 [Deltaproteobacteria bacterium]|nr:hypothetical protein [Deltaproteobacteria bacterium]
MARHELVQRDARACVCAIRVGAKHVRIRGELVTAFDEDWLLLLTPIVDEQRALLRDALAFNMELAIGALAIDQGWLMLRATHVLALLDDRLIDRHLDFVAREALRLRSILTLDTAPVDHVFAHACE